MVYPLNAMKLKSRTTNKQKEFQKILIKKRQNFYILFAFLLITITLLIVVSIYCYLIKSRVSQKHVIRFHVRNNELKEIIY